MKKYLLLIVIIGFATGAYAKCPEGEVLGANSGECIPASGTWDNGTKGSGTWTMTADGTLTISGSGTLKDFGLNLDGNATPWRDADIKNFVVADGIEAIGPLGLAAAGKVNIQLADSIKKLTGYVFYKAQTDNIILPKGLEEITNAFYDKRIKRVVIPESVEKFTPFANSPTQMTMYCPPKWLDKCTGNNVTSFAYEKVGDEYLVYNKDGTIKASFKNYDDLAKDNILANYQKNADGSTSIYNKDGNLVGIKGKKIYTVEEAEAVTAHGDRFHVSLTYK